jgi:hypothetical protein
VSSSATVAYGANYFQNKGGVVTVSAGNYSAFDPSADNPNVLTISATDPNDAIYSWSNTGNNVDFAAPGCVYTTVNGGGYTSACGTSFSAPVVAGVAALVLSANPNLTAADLLRVLQQSADDLGPAGWDPGYGWGRINAARAVSMVAAPPPADTQPPSVSFVSPGSGQTVSGALTVQASALDNVGVASVTLAIDGATLCTAVSAPYACAWNTANSSNSVHTLTATARDGAGNTSSASVTAVVSNVVTLDTTPPVVTILSPANGSRIPNSGNVSVSVSASDNVRVTRVELYVDGYLATSSTSAPFNMSWNGKKSGSGAHTLQCKAYDAAGNAGVSQIVTVFK